MTSRREMALLPRFPHCSSRRVIFGSKSVAIFMRNKIPVTKFSYRIMFLEMLNVLQRKIPASGCGYFLNSNSRDRALQTKSKIPALLRREGPKNWWYEKWKPVEAYGSTQGHIRRFSDPRDLVTELDCGKIYRRAPLRRKKSNEKITTGWGWGHLSYGRVSEDAHRKSDYVRICSSYCVHNFRIAFYFRRASISTEQMASKFDRVPIQGLDRIHRMEKMDQIPPTRITSTESLSHPRKE